MVRGNARRFRVGWVALAVAQSCAASMIVNFDKLDPADGVTLPPQNLVVVDFEVQMSVDDAIRDVGLQGFARNGAEIVYAYDASGVVPSAPGVDNRFVTFFSRPRGRDDPSRYDNRGFVTVGISYCGLQPFPRFNLGHIDATSVSSALDGVSGYVLRVAIDLTGVSDPAFQIDSPAIVVALQRPPDSIVLFEAICPNNMGGLGASSDDHALVRFDWGIYGIIPEPGTGLLALSLGALTCFTIRRSRR